MIHTMAQKAKSVAEEFFQVTDPIDVLTSTQPRGTEETSSGDTVKVDLGDGMVANVDLSGIGG